FVGYTPPEAPRILILVMVEGRGDSHEIASPMARQLMDLLLPNDPNAVATPTLAPAARPTSTPTQAAKPSPAATQAGKQSPAATQAARQSATATPAAKPAVKPAAATPTPSSH